MSLVSLSSSFLLKATRFMKINTNLNINTNIYSKKELLLKMSSTSTETIINYKCGFMFPGQGAQNVGMAEKLCEELPAAKDLFDNFVDAISMNMFYGQNDN